MLIILSCQSAALQFNSDKSPQTRAQPPPPPSQSEQICRNASTRPVCFHPWPSPTSLIYVTKSSRRSRRTSTTPISREMHKLRWCPLSRPALLRLVCHIILDQQRLPLLKLSFKRSLLDALLKFFATISCLGWQAPTCAASPAFAGNHRRGPTSDILFHNSTELSGGGILASGHQQCVCYCVSFLDA